MTAATICYGGEMRRIWIRSIRLLVIDGIGWMEYVERMKAYIIRGLLSAVGIGWNSVKDPAKKYAAKFVKEVVLENAEDLSAFVSTTAGSAAVAFIVQSLSSRLTADIMPSLVEWIRTADVARGDDGTMNRLLEDVGEIRQSSIQTEIRLMQMDETITRHFANLHLELEQIRIHQPEKFNEIILRILPYVSMKDLLAISTTIPVSIIQYLTNKAYTNSLEDGPRF